MSDKPNTPVIIDDGEAITIKVGTLVGKFYKDDTKSHYVNKFIVPLAEEVIRLKNENDALKKVTAYMKI